jgi:putative adenylate-forming enzyme
MIPFLSAFFRTLWLARHLKTREDVAKWQARGLKRLMRKTLPAFPYYAHLHDCRFKDLPVMDKAQLMTNFAALNAPGITADEGWKIFSGDAPQRRGYSIGASTGTSGNRGLYVVSDQERQAWLGVMLAKTLPRFPRDSARIALILPLNSALYKTAAVTPRLSLRFFDLNDGLEAIFARLPDYRPDTIIAPPKVLRALAEQGMNLPLRRIFSGAEVLDPLDKTVIEARFHLRVRQIYMATEGLLGVACDHGTLHLCEDVMHFDFEAVAGSDLVSPVITDFTRTAQAMCRYRMNDLLRLSQTPCPCGSPYQAVTEIAGRCDDLFQVSGQTITPDILRNAIVDADRRITDFRLRQTGPFDIDLILPIDTPPEAAQKAKEALSTRLSGLNITAHIALRQESLSTSARKLRRVERTWKG